MNTWFGEPYNTTFVDVWAVEEEEPYADSGAKFVYEYEHSELYDVNNCITSTNARRLFYLLYSRYGNSSLATTDITRFKYRLYDIIYQYGPSWEKKLDIQNQVRALTADEIATGAKAIYNSAYNPGTAPSTATLEELTAINEQKTTNYTKGKIEALANQWEMINNDVTNAFLEKFKVLFTKVAVPTRRCLFPVEDEE